LKVWTTSQSITRYRHIGTKPGTLVPGH